MRVILKTGDEIFLEDNQEDGFEIGDNLILYDENRRGVLIQLIEMDLMNFSQVHQNLIDKKDGTQKVAIAYQNNFQGIKENNRILHFKILKEINNKENKIDLVDWSGWIPSKISNISKIEKQWILNKIKGKPKYNFKIGKTDSGDDFILDSFDLQGITLIIGKKGSGKSHASKIILKDLISKGCKLLVFDINDEYSDLKFKKNYKGNKDNFKPEISELNDKIITLTPGENFKFSLEYVGMDVLYDVLTIPLKLPDASGISFRNIWSYLEKKNYLRMNEFFKVINSENNPHVREALYRRMRQITDTNLFTDENSENTNFNKLFDKMEKGGALIINLKTSTQTAKIIAVQTILSKIEEMLENGTQPFWIIAEEAHLYLNKTAWEDIVTRMRHLGAYQIYITNNPESLSDMIIRQSDNIFLFKLVDRKEISYISPAVGLDSDTLLAITRSLPFGKCVAIGEITKGFPFIIKVKSLESIKTGRTRLFLK